MYTLLDADFHVLLDGIDEYSNVDPYAIYWYDDALFFDDLTAVRVGATDWYMPDGGPWARMYFNSQYMLIDRSGKPVGSGRYDEVSFDGSRWYGERGSARYLLDDSGGETALPNGYNTPSAWAASAVEQAAERGIRLAYGGSPYRLNIRRDEFCKLALQTIHAVQPERALPELAPAFSDCTDETVRQIAALGIVTGYEDGTFQPKRALSRQEAAVILHRLYTLLYGDFSDETAVKPYADAGKIGAWAKDSVYAMQQCGIMQGKSRNQFCPKDGYTIEQAIVTMLRMTQVE